MLGEGNFFILQHTIQPPKVQKGNLSQVTSAKLKLGRLEYFSP